MTVGQTIKYYRVKNGLTQKELSEQLCVSFQTVSKWENDTNEPDLMTLKMMCKIFHCTVDDLINNEKEENIVFSESNNETNKIKISVCKDCGKPLFNDDNIHHIEKISPSGVKETIDICDECFIRRETTNQQKLAEAQLALKKEKENIEKAKEYKKARNKKTLLIWSLVTGIAVFAAVLAVCIVYYNQVRIAGTIILPFLGGYGLFSFIYCVFSDNWITDLFIDIASFSIKMPGIIFSFDADGLKFLIAMKILFWILGIVIMVGAILLAIAICSILSMFAFPFIINK